MQPVASHPLVVPSDKSTRSDDDAAAGDEMGIACTRPCKRVMAAIGLLPGHSYRMESAGSEAAARKAWKLTVRSAIRSAARAAPRNASGLSGVW